MPLTSVLEELNVDPDDVITDENLQAEADEAASDDLGITDPDLEFPGEGELIVTEDENTGGFNSFQAALDEVETGETIFAFGDFTDEDPFETSDDEEDITIFISGSIPGGLIGTPGLTLSGNMPDDAPNVDRDGNPLP